MKNKLLFKNNQVSALIGEVTYDEKAKTYEFCLTIELNEQIVLSEKLYTLENNEISILHCLDNYLNIHFGKRDYKWRKY